MIIIIIIINKNNNNDNNNNNNNNKNNNNNNNNKYTPSAVIQKVRILICKLKNINREKLDIRT